MTIVKGKPENHHSITPHLTVKDAVKAITFYEKAFGAEELLRLPAPNGMVAHSDLKIGDSIFWLCDEMPEFGNKAPQTVGGSSVAINIFVQEVDIAFDRAVKAGATVLQPPTDMFWGARFSRVLDPFGHVWSLATQQREVSGEEMEAMMKEMAKAKAKPPLPISSIQQTMVLRGPAKKIYEALLDQKTFAKLTGAPATIDPKVGGMLSLFGDMVVARNLELVPGKRVVQAWRSKSWAEGVHSLVRFELEETGGETAVTLEQVGYPEDQRAHLASGWEQHYWGPLRSHLTRE